MNGLAKSATDLVRLNGKINRVYARKILNAEHSFVSRFHASAADSVKALRASGLVDAWQAWAAYAIDAFQRTVLFWDAICQRGNIFLEHEGTGKPPSLDYQRHDEKPFAAVDEVSALSEKIYTLFVRPFVRPPVNGGAAELGRTVHRLRVEHWAASDLNPMMWPISALASVVKTDRQAAQPENPYRCIEAAVSNVVTAWLDLYRDLRDATMERLVFRAYSPAAVLGLVESPGPVDRVAARDPRELPQVREALGAIGSGGYAKAVALMGALIGRGAGQSPLDRLKMIEKFIYNDKVLSKLSAAKARQLRSEQAVVAELEPERGLQSLPMLLDDPADRQRALALLEAAVADIELTAAQATIVDQVRLSLSANGAARAKARSTRGSRRTPR